MELALFLTCFGHRRLSNPQSFMFDKPLTIKSKDGTKTIPPYKMLQPIKKSKYPDITEVSTLFRKRINSIPHILLSFAN